MHCESSSGQSPFGTRDRQRHPSTSGPADPPFEPYGLLHKFFAVLSAILPTASILVTVGYWAAVRKGPGGGAVFVDEPIKHGGNAVITLVEIMISRLPMTSTWAAWPVWYINAYTIFQVIFHAIRNEWVYAGTDFRQCRSLPAYLILPLGTLFVYAALYAP
jgi:hypothetical protein